jgi:O-antigen ligase
VTSSVARSLSKERALSFLLSAYVVSLATSISGMELFASLLVVAVLILYKGFPPFKSVPFLPSILAFVLVAWISTLLSDAAWADKRYDLQRMRFFFLYIFLFFGLLQAEGMGFRWEKPLLWVVLFIAVYGTIQHFVGVDWFRPEGKKVILYAIADQKIGPLVIGTFNHHLTFSNIYLIYACLFTAWGLSELRTKWGYFVVGLWLFLLCAWTHSRTGWLTIGVVGAILAGWKSRKAVGIALLLFVGLIAFLFMTDAGFRGRVDRTFIHPDEAYSADSRTRLWHANWEMFKSSPLLGVGYNNNERHAKEMVDKLYPETKETNFYGHAHCAFLQVLTATGILGLIAFLCIWVGVFRKNFLWIRHASSSWDRWTAIGLSTGLIGFHLQGLTQWNFGDAEVIHNIIFWWAVIATRKI